MLSLSKLRDLFSPAPCNPQTAVKTTTKPPANVITAGDFTINTAKGTVTLAGHDLPLNAEEFDVLMFLATHPRHLVTPHTVPSINWRSNQLRHTEFLKALMSLRAKLEAGGAGKRYLQTEPWVIYRFDSTASFAI